MRSHRLQVTGSRQQSQQDGVRHKVESWEGPALVVEVTHQRLEADLQLFVDVAQNHSLGNLAPIATLNRLNINSSKN